ncbi:hypothetical protein [Prochlorococcus sp. ALOHA_ZT_50]|uniref:hypothetical protein n=1 Tax=Prochlorococcus sp. ALOHA_ZT_50 TaxID=2919303 RepID=UPI00257DA3EB|nr:hypothetical protein [Prochlorococcus sp. ALOHA_ZT_50]MCH2079607.1 hypothetical protein [Prochlorococcus sp. ALOHA_ZT_50]
MEFANFSSIKTETQSTGLSMNFTDNNEYTEGDYIGKKIVSLKSDESKRIIILANQISPNTVEGVFQFWVHESFLDDGSEFGHKAFALCVAENVDDEGNTKPCELCKNKVPLVFCILVPVIEEYTDKNGNIGHAKKLWAIRQQGSYKKQIEKLLEQLCEWNEKYGTVRGLGLTIERKDKQSSKTGSIGYWQDDDENPVKIKRFTEEELIEQFGSDEVREEGKVKYAKNIKITPHELGFFNLEKQATYIEALKGFPVKKYKG